MKGLFVNKASHFYADAYTCRWDMAFINIIATFILSYLLIMFIWDAGLYVGAEQPNVAANLIAALVLTVLNVLMGFYKKKALGPKQ